MTGPLILLYHRVTTLDTDPQLLAVTPDNFAAHLAVLREIATPTSLRDLVAATRDGEDLRNAAVAVTFDDGYADNLLTARPILRRQGVPATVFVATAGIHTSHEFFWDELDRIFLQPNRLPATLQLRVGPTPYQTDLGDDATYSPAHAARHRDWNVTLAENPTARHRAYRELCALIHNAPSHERQRTLRQLRQWSGLGTQARATHRMLSEPQLRELAGADDDDLIEIGAHTVAHPLLSAETPETQTREILDSKTALEAILNRPVRAFSYPFGGRRDYTPHSVAAVRQTGFEYACSNFPAPITPDQGPFQLPRVIVRNWPADEFRERLTEWLRPRFAGPLAGRVPV